VRERVFSLETEYAIAFHTQNGRNPPSRQSIVEALRRPLVERCGIPNSHFLVNGSKFHYDVGHAEWSLPECRNAYEAAVYDKAADRMLASLLSEAEAQLAQQGYNGKLLVVKNNADADGNTYGCHENYMAVNQTPWLNFKDHLLLTTRYLIPFLVTRQLFCGAGRVGYGRKLEAGVGFQMMQRADFIEKIFSEETQSQRAIISLARENEPLAQGHYRRLHLILADANLSGWATYLKLGTTGIVLRLLEELGFQTIPHLLDPLAALRQISRDPTCSVRIPLQDGNQLTAIEIQRLYLKQAQDYFNDRTASRDEQQIMHLWEEALNQLETGPDRLFGKVDWVTKKRLMDKYLASVGKAWEDVSPGETTYYELLRLDIQYHNLSPQEGLFARLLKGKTDLLVSAEEVQQAQNNPPPYTRAWIRGTAIAAAREQWLDIEVDRWDKFRVNGRTIAINNPLQFVSPELCQIARIPQVTSKTNPSNSNPSDINPSDINPSETTRHSSYEQFPEEEHSAVEEMIALLWDSPLEDDRNRGRYQISIYASEPDAGERVNQSLIASGYRPASIEANPNLDCNIKWGSATEEIIDEIAAVICQELALDPSHIQRLHVFDLDDDDIYINLATIPVP